MKKEGWECPKCKKVWAPSVAECESCSPENANKSFREKGEPMKKIIKDEGEPMKKHCSCFC